LGGSGSGTDRQYGSGCQRNILEREVGHSVFSPDKI
jgi:hypothetical protein